MLMNSQIFGQTMQPGANNMESSFVYDLLMKEKMEASMQFEMHKQRTA